MMNVIFILFRLLDRNSKAKVSPVCMSSLRLTISRSRIAPWTKGTWQCRASWWSKSEFYTNMKTPVTSSIRINSATSIRMFWDRFRVGSSISTTSNHCSRLYWSQERKLVPSAGWRFWTSLQMNSTNGKNRIQKWISSVSSIPVSNSWT